MEVKKRENRVKKLNSKQELKSEIRQPPNFDLIKIGERIMKVSDLNVGLEEMVKIYELAEEWECSPETVINTLVYRNEILTNSLKKAKECVKEIPMDEELPEETKNSVRSCLAYFLVEIGRRVELAQDFTKRSQSPE